MNVRGTIAVAIVASSATGFAWAAPRLAASVTTRCASSAACVTARNTGAGAGVSGSTVSGTGVRGVTSGTSAGAAGIAGAAVSGTGVAGTSTNGPGIEAISTAANAVVATSSGAKPALTATTTGGGAGVEALALKGTAITATGPQAFAAAGAFVNRTPTGDLLTLIGSAGATSFSVDQAGDVYFGSFTPVACAPAYLKLWGACAAVQPPAARSSTTGFARPSRWTAQVVRVGRAILAGGVARVALDPSLAHRVARYRVFLGDSGSPATWLYVAERAPGSFVVREHGGRSTTSFDYRLIADVLPDAAFSAASRPL